MKGDPMTGPAYYEDRTAYATAPPLAVEAHAATTHGQCTRCQQAITPGQRIAKLPDGEWLHVCCVA